MALDLGLEEDNLFQHSEEFEQGLGNVRKGAGTFLVALDGTGDFQDLQEAINALGVGGGVIYLKEGEYNLTATVTLNKDNISIIGAGKSTQLISDGNNAVFSISSDYCSIENVYIDAADNNQATGNYGIYVNGKSCFIRGCWLKTARYGIYLNANSKLICTGNYLWDNAYAIAFFGNGAGGTSAEGSLISNNEIHDNNYFGIFIFNSNYCLIEGNVIHDTTGAGTAIYLTTGADYNVIHGNIIYNNTGSPEISVGASAGTHNLVFDNLPTINNSLEFNIDGGRADEMPVVVFAIDGGSA